MITAQALESSLHAGVMWFDNWLDADRTYLSDRTPLPLDTPFTTVLARQQGVGDRRLGELVAAGLIRRVCRGVYVVQQVDDSMALRCAALRLVIAADAVVTDRTAGWLHGMPVLKRGSHLVAPPIEVCRTTDTRTTMPTLDGHRRMLATHDVEERLGIVVTTPLRTCLDLGRLTWRYDAIAALDSGLRLGVSHTDMTHELARFKGFRGVRQLRTLLEVADPRSESPGESALRLHWHEAGLPQPELQIWLTRRSQNRYRLDIGTERVRYAAEYDGEEFHTGDEAERHDKERRSVISSEFGWELDVFRREIYQDLSRTQQRLRAGFERAVERPARWMA